jgi:hypothetical protein
MVHFETNREYIIDNIYRERLRQINSEGFSEEHDDKYKKNELVDAAISYCLGDGIIHKFWPWDKSWWKPKSKRENLVKAAALIVAEIERIDRENSSP